MQAVAIEILSSLLIKEVENAATSNVSFPISGDCLVAIVIFCVSILGAVF